MKKILIIEDDITIRCELENLLKGNGYEVVAVQDFKDTIGLVKTSNPHLILLDIKLPGENGFSICSKIRSFSQVPLFL